MSAGGRGIELKAICETVIGFGLWLVTLRTTELGLVTEYDNTMTFSGRERVPVIAPAHTATAVASATATAMSITVAITGLSALRNARAVSGGRSEHINAELVDTVCYFCRLRSKRSKPAVTRRFKASAGHLCLRKKGLVRCRGLSMARLLCWGSCCRLPSLW
jgi:hypothetical protein